MDEGGDNFKNSELASRYLVRGSENYRGAIIKHIEHTWERGWEDLKETVLVGHPPQEDPEKWVDARPARDRSRGPGLYLGHARHRPGPGPQGGGQAGSEGRAPPPGPGGRPGHLCHLLCPGQPGLAATVFDLPMPLKIARENIEKNGLTDRVDTLAGNFLQDDIGGGYDFIWVSQILHSHDEGQCRLIIAKAVAALTGGGTLAIQDFYLNADGASPTGAAMFGVHMLAVTPRGRAYTSGEVAAWMQEAGLAAPEFMESGMDASILLAKKV